MKKKNFDISLILKIISIALLALSVLHHVYGHYDILRWVVTITAVYSAYLAYDKKDTIWVAVFVIIAILFNPIEHIYFRYSTWQIIEIAAAAAFAISIYFKKK